MSNISVEHRLVTQFYRYYLMNVDEFCLCALSPDSIALVELQLQLLKRNCKWKYGSTEGPVLGKRFHHFMGAATDHKNLVQTRTKFVTV